ncbi:LamG-like jellyroll fold domain-containing protein [Rhodovulum sp. FJ3]|uniref:LamG-like jellyroll fold domain-containing protein n=1 Tax=Rhodovulum sp. FJ3 TaxID=3079053 RepID=UPI00293DAAE0|nr:LamG-like jellyroll fold domain-containing protein [Rhodovulum sp. FJ3]MDV4167827.1 LamG-like jellyroll fold domain-containing protein [Rhodovulum sp. FJ3]
MTVYIQQLPVTGSGEVLYPDAAMDAGTACLVDLVDGWAWGGSIPADGESITGGNVLNYALADDGWDETPGAVTSSGITGDGNGAAVLTQAHYITLPPAFIPPTGTTKFGVILWVKNEPATTVQSGGNNPVFALGFSSGTPVSIGLNYSNYVATGAFVAGLGFNAGPAPVLAALTDGAVHQIAIEYDTTTASASTLKIYVDGVHVSTFSSSNGSAIPDTITRAVVGRDPRFSGAGIIGKFMRATMELTGTPGARPFAETVALDYSLNSARLAV